MFGVADPEWMASLPVTAHGFRLRPVDELVVLLQQASLGEVRHERVAEDNRGFHLLIANVGGNSPNP